MLINNTVFELQRNVTFHPDIVKWHARMCLKAETNFSFEEIWKLLGTTYEAAVALILSINQTKVSDIIVSHSYFVITLLHEL